MLRELREPVHVDCAVVLMFEGRGARQVAQYLDFVLPSPDHKGGHMGLLLRKPPNRGLC